MNDHKLIKEKNCWSLLCWNRNGWSSKGGRERGSLLVNNNQGSAGNGLFVNAGWWLFPFSQDILQVLRCHAVNGIKWCQWWLQIKTNYVIFQLWISYKIFFTRIKWAWNIFQLWISHKIFFTNYFFMNKLHTYQVGMEYEILNLEN